MSDEATASDKALNAQGATNADLSAGASGDGAPAAPPAPANEPPKVGKDEEHGTPAAAATDKTKEPVVDEAAAAAAAREAQAAKEKAAREAGPLTEYISIEHPAAQAAINLLKEAGVHPNEADRFFDKALQSGDLADIDVAGLEARVGKDKATLIMAGVSSYHGAIKSQSEATVKQTHEIFGNEANWIMVRDWAKTAEKADAGLRSKVDAIRDMLDQGGVQAELGAKELLRLYNTAPGNKGLGTTKLATGSSTGTVVGTALSRSDYLTALKEAHARGARPAEIQALDARRRAGKAAGL